MVKPPFFPVHIADFRGELKYHDLTGTEELTLGGISVTAASDPAHRYGAFGFRIEADGAIVACCRTARRHSTARRWPLTYSQQNLKS